MEQAKHRRNLDLYDAAITGDWERAKTIFQQDKSALTTEVTGYNKITLLIAAGTGRATNFVKNLVELMKVEAPDALEYADSNRMTALHLAARYCNKETVVILANECPELLYLYGGWAKEWLPVHWAAESADKESLLYMLDLMYNDVNGVPKPLAGIPGAELLMRVINSEFYDVALDLLHRYPHLANLQNEHHDCALKQIAQKCSAFPSGSRLLYSWKRFIYSYVPVRAQLEKYAEDYVRVFSENPATISSPRNVQKHKWAQLLWEKFSNFVPLVKHIQREKLMHERSLLLVKILCKEMRSADDIKATESLAKAAVLEATRSGIHEVVEEIVSSFPSVIWQEDSNGGYIFHMAVVYRHENVFNLIYNMSEHRYCMVQRQDFDGNTMLHLAGKMAPLDKLKLVSGAALQMQRELQWYKEVEKFVSPSYRVLRNGENQTPSEVFTKKHAQLAIDGEKWMKDTTNSLTIVAALIVTVVFAAAITVPGGNNGSNGFPIFSNNPAFIVFSIFNATSLFASTTSLMVFLSILTSRYAEIDFLYILPKRLIIGLLTLFLSISSMMIAFSATVYIVFGQRKGWILIPVSALTCLPIASFVTLQFPLMVDLIYSTYGNSFGKQSDRPFY